MKLLFLNMADALRPTPEARSSDPKRMERCSEQLLRVLREVPDVQLVLVDEPYNDLAVTKGEYELWGFHQEVLDRVYDQVGRVSVALDGTACTHLAAAGLQVELYLEQKHHRVVGSTEGYALLVGHGFYMKYMEPVTVQLSGPDGLTEEAADRLIMLLKGSQFAMPADQAGSRAIPPPPTPPPDRIIREGSEPRPPGKH